MSENELKKRQLEPDSDQEDQNTLKKNKLSNQTGDSDSSSDSYSNASSQANDFSQSNNSHSSDTNQNDSDSNAPESQFNNSDVVDESNSDGTELSLLDMDHDSYTQMIVLEIIEDAHNTLAGREVEHFHEDDSRYQFIAETAEWIRSGENVTVEYVIDRWNNRDSAPEDQSGNNQDSSPTNPSRNNHDSSPENESRNNSDSSLIDDYADPNLEQPSHMDPDD